MTGHDDWVALAHTPAGVTLDREEGRVGADEFRTLLTRCAITRPKDDPARLRTMLAHANLIVTARDAHGTLIGIARSITDFAYCCYLSDLCVDEGWQRRGIGRALIGRTKQSIGPETMLLLLSAPSAMGYYAGLGLEKVENGFVIRRDR